MRKKKEEVVEKQENVIYNKSVKEIIKENQETIIANKEKFYDKMIDKMHLSTLAIDIFIAVLIIGLVVIIITQAKI